MNKSFENIKYYTTLIIFGGLEKREKPEYMEHKGFNVTILCAIIQRLHSHTES